MQKIKLILASSSPRRKELLGHLFLPFESHTSNIEETTNELDPGLIVMDLARQKTIEVSKNFDQDRYFIIGSDTIVYFNNRVLGKPKTHVEATQTLRMLSGKTHEVYTGVCFSHNGEIKTFYEKTKVEFEKIDMQLMDSYVKTNDPMDKAGAYGIQGSALSFVKSLNGSYSNVMGFPINTVLEELLKHLDTDYKGLHEIFNS
jgi:septum formation protein